MNYIKNVVRLLDIDFGSFYFFINVVMYIVVGVVVC